MTVFPQRKSENLISNNSRRAKDSGRGICVWSSVRVAMFVATATVWENFYIIIVKHSG